MITNDAFMGDIQWSREVKTWRRYEQDRSHRMIPPPRHHNQRHRAMPLPLVIVDEARVANRDSSVISHLLLVLRLILVSQTLNVSCHA